MKRLLAVIAVLLSLLLLSGTAVWLLRDSIAESVANRMLQDNGLRIKALVDIRPSFTRATIGEIVVEQIDSGRIQRFNNIDVSYSVPGLLSGQVREVQVGRADLDTATGAAASEPAAEIPRLTDVSEMIRQAPLESLHIDELQIGGRSMTLTLRWQNNRLTGKLGDGETDIELDIDWQLARRESSPQSPALAAPLEASIRAQTGSLPALDIELDVVPKNGMLDVQGASHVESDTAQPVINAVAELLSLPALPESPLSVSAAIAVQARLPDALDFSQILQLEWTLPGDHMAITVPHIGTVGTDSAEVINAVLTLNTYELHCLSLASCQFSASSELQAESATFSLPDTAETSRSIHLREPSVKIPMLDGSLEDNTLTFQASTGTLLSLPEADLVVLSAWNTEATLHSSASLHIPLENMHELRLEADELSVDLPLLRSGDSMSGLQLRAQQLDTMPLGSFMLNTHIHLSNAYTNLFSLNLWDATLMADIAVDNDIADLDASVVFNDRTVAIINASHDLTAFTGQGRLAVSGVTFDESGNRLSDLIDPLPVSADILSGTVAGQAELQWHRHEGQAMPAFTGIVDFAVTDLGGFFDSVGFVDLNTRIHAKLDEEMHLQSLTEEYFRVGRVDVGVIIEDIETSFRFNSAGPSITLREVGMSIFDGRIMADHFDYDASAAENTNTLILDRLDIARIMSLSAYEGVTATGTVVGEIPLTISGTRFTVSGGMVDALPPGGTISYRDAPVGTGNSNLDLVYSALRNYRYSRMDADVDYMADGELLLAVSMEGIAPDIEDQRINLNVNISDNIPDLLESLQAGRDIAEAMELQYGIKQ